MALTMIQQAFIAGFMDKIASIIHGEDVSKSRRKEIEEAINQTHKISDKFFNHIPEMPEVHTYAGRERYIEDLKKRLGLNKRTTEMFRESGSPRPLDGKMLIPHNQSKGEISHELAHHILEQNTSKENLMKAKWLDEGAASYISNQTYHYWTPEEALKVFKDKFGDDMIPISRMGTESQWDKLYKNDKTKNQSYIQSEAMVNYFFDKYSKDKFKKVLEAMKTKSPDEAFKSVIGKGINEFGNEFKRYATNNVER